MADGTVQNVESGGDTIATDDISGVKHQLVKIEWGPADTANQTDDASGKRLPVKVAESLPAGSANIGDVDVLTLPGVAGDVAHDTGDSGNPVKVGGKAANALPTAVANNDRTNL